MNIAHSRIDDGFMVERSVVEDKKPMGGPDSLDNTENDLDRRYSRHQHLSDYMCAIVIVCDVWSSAASLNLSRDLKVDERKVQGKRTWKGKSRRNPKVDQTS